MGSSLHVFGGVELFSITFDLYMIFDKLLIVKLAQNFRMDGSPGRDAELVELVQQFVNVRCIGVKWTDATGEGVFSGTMLSESGTSVCLRITVILDTGAGELLVSSTDAMLVSAN